MTDPNNSIGIKCCSITDGELGAAVIQTDFGSTVATGSDKGQRGTHSGHGHISGNLQIVGSSFSVNIEFTIVFIEDGFGCFKFSVDVERMLVHSSCFGDVNLVSFDVNIGVRFRTDIDDRASCIEITLLDRSICSFVISADKELSKSGSGSIHFSSDINGTVLDGKASCGKTGEIDIGINGFSKSTECKFTCHETGSDGGFSGNIQSTAGNISGKSSIIGIDRSGKFINLN